MPLTPFHPREGGASYYVQPRTLGGKVSPCRTRSEGAGSAGGAWEVWERAVRGCGGTVALRGSWGL